ncbi:MAG: ERAP1-like C-terminal domain-containing protein, partial [Nitrospiraceae bacterium]|nr:ERAP1-like C-terminal domain-containing protein [Nitrospiraceae bacterium]
MLEQHIGPAVFRAGVRGYLQRHAYGNADTNDLWVSLGHAAQQPVPDLMNGWIFQTGIPLLTAAVTGGSELTLTQQRFSYLPQASAGDQLWQVPVQIRIVTDDQVEHRRLLLTDRHTTVSLPPNVQQVIVNEAGHGFYRVRYDSTLLQRLLNGGLDRLASVERFNVVSDAWATTVAGHMPLDEYVDLTAHFRHERDKNVWAVLLDSFSFFNRIVADSDRPALEAFVRSRLSPVVAELGWEPAAGENHLVRQLRGELIGALGKLGNDPVTQQQAVEHYQRYTEDPAAVDPNLLPAIVVILAHTGDISRYEEFSARYQRAQTPQEERRYLFSLAAFKEPALLARTLARSTNGEMRTQDAPFMVSAVLGNVYGRAQAWNFVKAHWDEMERLFPKQGLRRMCGGFVALATPELEREVLEFVTTRKVDLGGKTLAQYLEQLRIAVAFREREASRLPTYLAQTGRLRAEGIGVVR